jgi:hypothetical protein
MGYYTNFSGKLSIEPPLKHEEFHETPFHDFFGEGAGRSLCELTRLVRIPTTESSGSRLEYRSCRTMSQRRQTRSRKTYSA